MTDVSVNTFFKIMDNIRSQPVSTSSDISLGEFFSQIDEYQKKRSVSNDMTDEDFFAQLDAEKTTADKDTTKAPKVRRKGKFNKFLSFIGKLKHRATYHQLDDIDQ